MDREAWRAVIHGVAKSRTRLSDCTELNSQWRAQPLLSLDSAASLSFVQHYLYYQGLGFYNC